MLSKKLVSSHLWLMAVGVLGELPHLRSRSPCTGEQEKLSRACKPSDLWLFSNRQPFVSSPFLLPGARPEVGTNKPIHLNSATPRCTRVAACADVPPAPTARAAGGFCTQAIQS